MNELLYHHGILGQRWGIRRFQNKDGTLTDAGRKRYDVDIESAKNGLIKPERKESKQWMSIIKNLIMEWFINRKKL